MRFGKWKPRDHVEGAVLVLELEAKDVLARSIRLRVPRAIRKIELGTVSGDILVEGAQGNLDIETVSGDVHVHDPCSGGKIVTVSGDVVMEEVSGEVCVGTTSGDITIRARPGFRGGPAPSSSGDLEMELVGRLKKIAAGETLTFVVEQRHPLHPRVWSLSNHGSASLASKGAGERLLPDSCIIAMLTP
ncbi:MAG: DUF4097 family beta strand repeat-containing protein [Rectinemataceae bacterium]